jgi:hypothetical protein
MNEGMLVGSNEMIGEEDGSVVGGVVGPLDGIKEG